MSFTSRTKDYDLIAAIEDSLGLVSRRVLQAECRPAFLEQNPV